MSAWPEAVWLAKQMKQNFETNSSLSVYQADLKDWQNDLKKDEQTLKSLSSEVTSLSGEVLPPIVDIEDDGHPATPLPSGETYKKGMIWFVVQGTSSDEDNSSNQGQNQDAEQQVGD